MTTDNPVKLVWIPFDDEHGNQAWQAESVIYQTGTEFFANYYLYQRLRHNQIEWYADYDLTIWQQDAEVRAWPSLETAKAAAQATEYRLLAAQPVDVNAETA